MNLPSGARVVGFDIVFPMRGPPPKFTPPDGYIVSPSDPYRWVLAYKSCKYRQIGIPTKCPLGMKLVDRCSLIGLQVQPSYCQTCTKREE